MPKMVTRTSLNATFTRTVPVLLNISYVPKRKNGYVGKNHTADVSSHEENARQFRSLNDKHCCRKKAGQARLNCV